ncbi:light-sensor Protein kinase-like isoform X1 [Physcomitrium patens]|uniref:Protein kinase domain-containing protein n=1 Tax=Physcomitrium patens TaxID=3218 RepID=A0A2K1JTQ3_PHYPA|nr:hypothetical protein PHYPA_014685 [Physcomitrium patens]
MTKSLYKSTSNLKFTAEYANTLEQFLKLTKECRERAQKMTTPSAFSSPPKVNSELCKHLADKLKSAVESAQSFLHRRFLSLEDKAKYIDVFKLFYALAYMAVKVIRSCCQEEWIQAAFLMTNVPEHILSTSFDLEMLAHFFSGSLRSTEVLESIFKAEVAIVNEKASHDRESLVGDLNALLQRRENVSTETYRLASLLLERLDPQRQNLGGSSSGAYCVDMESLKEMEQLGKGSFATVFKAMWLGVEVAKKTFYAPSSPDFEKEVSILARLSHPNIVSLLCYAEGKRESCMVMELMDGDLCGLMRKIMAEDESRSCPFSMLEAVDLMLQVGRGMEYLHEMRIVHRDLKAMNILVKQVKGKDGRSWYIWAKVADFGLSKTKERSVTYSNQTLNTGTTRWMPPEMIKESVNGGQEEVTNVGMTAKYPFGGDVYSFAMVCYEILTGDVPFYDIAQHNEVKKKVLKGDRPGLPKDCPTSLERLIRRCWSQDASARPRFDEICVELRNVKCQTVKSRPNLSKVENVARSADLRDYSLAEIAAATEQFKRIIGRGFTGDVYFGKLEDGSPVAVKRGKRQTPQRINFFETEIAILSKLRHRHLVSLIGYCEEGGETILVYDYMANGPLVDHLYGTNRAPLAWKQRLEICIGAARGLHYLHTGTDQGIIHRGVQSRHILLDENLVAKVGGFGIAKTGPAMGQTYVTTAVRSIGSDALDPEYLFSGHLTQKSDMYSFGVVLMEVLCARRAIHPALPREQVNLGEWAMLLKKAGKLDQIVDEKIRHQISPDTLNKFVDTALKCVEKQGVNRPSMVEVLSNLEYCLHLHEVSQGYVDVPSPEQGNSSGLEGTVVFKAEFSQVPRIDNCVNAAKPGGHLEFH